MLLLNQLRKQEDAIDDICIEHSHVMDVKPGQLEKWREKDWKLSKCGATEE